MLRRVLVVVALAAMAVPATTRAQSPSEERRQEERDRAREARERAAERARERAERDRERERERGPASLDTTVSFGARGMVSVSCPGGAVVVRGGEAGTIRVKARTEGGGIRFTASDGRATLEPMLGRGCSDGRFEVTVPADARVVATTWSGSVSVSGVHGQIQAHGQSGDVDVRDAGDRLEIETLSGDVTVHTVRGDVSINTLSGDVTLAAVRGDVQAETVSGSLELRDISAKQVRAHSTSGDITFAGAIQDGGRYEFNTHSGEIGLDLPADVGAELSISTFNGSIDSDFPITLRAGEHGIGAAQAKRLDFTLGHGSARIVAETFSGDITLHRTRR